jgi:hypothetical protein
MATVYCGTERGRTVLLISWTGIGFFCLSEIHFISAMKAILAME